MRSGEMRRDAKRCEEMRSGEMRCETDERDARAAATLTNRTQEARVYSHDGPILRRKRGYILTTDQSYGFEVARARARFRVALRLEQALARARTHTLALARPLHLASQRPFWPSTPGIDLYRVPVRTASTELYLYAYDWSVGRIYPRFLRTIGPS